MFRNKMKTWRIKEKLQFLRIFPLFNAVPIFNDKNKVYTADLLEKFEVEFFAVARYLTPKEYKKHKDNISITNDRKKSQGNKYTNRNTY